LDCREKEERAVSIIPGASSAEEFEDDFEKQQDEGKETIVVCYCTIGYRSQKKVQELSKRLARSRPDVKAYNLSGSIVAWTHETDAPKLLDPKTGKETNRVHTYGKTWALQSVEYESVVYKRPVFEAVKGFFFKKKKK
jgi:rhodanese-related sulfurtransferase